METLAPIVPGWIPAQFKIFEASLNGASRAPIHLRRQEAFASLSRGGFPVAKAEEWKYTDLGDLLKMSFRPADVTGAFLESEFPDLQAAGLPQYRLVFVNGRVVTALSHLPDEAKVLVRSLSETMGAPSAGDDGKMIERYLGKLSPTEGDPFAALNTSFVREGAFVVIGEGAALSAPLALFFITSGAAKGVVTYPRVLIVAQPRSQATVVEYYLGGNGAEYLTNAVTEIVVEEGATVEHLKLQREGDKAFHVSTLYAQVARDATLTAHTFAFGGALVRNEIRPRLTGSGIHCVMNGLSVLNAEQHVDNHTVLDHAEPHCESSELFKGVYADRSSGVFSGTIIVHPQAQKTNAYQSNQSLLLSPEAKIDTRPQLKIWADDVKCTHGATIGQIDEEALFYIRSRGVGIHEARNMLIHAFASNIISQVKSAELRAHLEQVLMEKLERCRVVR